MPALAGLALAERWCAQSMRGGRRSLAGERRCRRLICDLTHRFAAVVPPAAPTGFEVTARSCSTQKRLNAGVIKMRRSRSQSPFPRYPQSCKRRRRNDGSDSGVSVIQHTTDTLPPPTRRSTARVYRRSCRRRRRNDGSDSGVSVIQHKTDTLPSPTGWHAIWRRLAAALKLADETAPLRVHR
jgi:hypothetical protein